MAHLDKDVCAMVAARDWAALVTRIEDYETVAAQKFSVHDSAAMEESVAGYGLLMAVCRLGDARDRPSQMVLARNLLSAGADPNEEDYLERTPTWFAAVFQLYKPLVDLLLEYKGVLQKTILRQVLKENAGMKETHELVEFSIWLVPRIGTLTDGEYVMRLPETLRGAVRAEIMARKEWSQLRRLLVEIVVRGPSLFPTTLTPEI